MEHNGAAHRLIAIEALLKIARQDERPMMGSDVGPILVFLLEDMKAQTLRDIATDGTFQKSP